MAIDLSEVVNKYKGLWVGLKKEDQTTVVASGTTVKEVMEKAKRVGYPQPILFKVPTQIIPFVGGFQAV